MYAHKCFFLITSLYSEKIDGTEDVVCEETRGRLIFQILMSLEDKMSLLFNILTQFNYAKQVYLFICKSYVIN